ncbi:MAG TPA: hypothetical protein VN282_14315 [Pyrinomonadaceae bacterium]|nr:hypothetical protein [Pyrinomonadaceae bacterium]
MFNLNTNVPRGAYLFAAAVGLVGVPFMYKLADFVSVMRLQGRPFATPVVLVLFAVGYLALGAAFAFLWPGAAWRWGVWLCAAPTCAAPFLTPDGRVFLACALVTMVPACAGAYGAHRLHLRRAGAP